MTNLVTAQHRLYIAGPMRKVAEFNFPTFHAAERTLTEAGYTGMFNPAAHDANNGFDTTGMTGYEDLTVHGFDLRAALKDDLVFITTTATGIAVLPGWRTSRGACAEVATADAIGIPVQEVAGWVQWAMAAA